VTPGGKNGFTVDKKAAKLMEDEKKCFHMVVALSKRGQRELVLTLSQWWDFFALGSRTLPLKIKSN
jgi:hypothetical protein